MLVPRTRTELGRRSFSVAAPTVWNSLPAHQRSTLIGRRQFRDGLKSHLFADAYFWFSENIRYKSVMYLLTYLPWTIYCVTVEAFCLERRPCRKSCLNLVTYTNDGANNRPTAKTRFSFHFPPYSVDFLVPGRPTQLDDVCLWTLDTN